jgi:hypothetical protein
MVTARRLLLLNAAVAVLAAACTSGSSNAPPTISFAQIQAEVAELQKAIDTSNQLYQASAASPTAKQIAANATAALDTAANVVIGLTVDNGASIQTYVQDFINAARTVLPMLAIVLNLNPATGTAIDLALAVIEAFIGGLPMPTITPQYTAAPLYPRAPVAIPLPSRMN